jgi:hypothetical protein
MSHFRKSYSTEKNSVYAMEYARLKNQSKVLNGEKILNVHSVLMDKENMEGLLLEIVGNKDGEYMRSNEWRDSFLKVTRRKEQGIEIEFEKRKKQAINLGYEPLTKMPDDLLEKLYREHAHEDILLEEIDFLKDKLKALAKLKEEVDESMILPYGPVCDCRLHSTDSELVGQLKLIDGQKVEMINGELLITCESSPYMGMKVSDFRKLCQTWYQERRQRDREKLPEIQARAKAAGQPIPLNYFTPQKKIYKKDLPKWPEGVTNFLKPQKDIPSDGR